MEGRDGVPHAAGKRRALLRTDLECSSECENRCCQVQDEKEKATAKNVDMVGMQPLMRTSASIQKAKTDEPTQARH